MATFRIGQRVKVAWVHSATSQHLIGLESVITEIEEASGGGPTVYGLAHSPLARAAIGSFIHVTGFAADQLTPIQPEGHQPCEQDFKLDLDRLLEREGVSA